MSKFALTDEVMRELSKVASGIVRGWVRDDTFDGISDEVKQRIIKCAQSTPYSARYLVFTYLCTGWLPTDEGD